MMNSLLRSRRCISALIFSGLLVLTGCVAAPPLSPPPKYDPAGFAPLRVDARKLEIIDNWVMPMQDPHMEHLLQPTPAQIVTDWASRVLVPAGGSGELILDISKASVVVTDLPPSEKITSLVKDNQDSRVRVELSARLMWLQPVGGQQGTGEIRAEASVTLPETARPVDYDVAIQETILEALALFDTEMRANIARIDGIMLP